MDDVRPLTYTLSPTLPHILSHPLTHPPLPPFHHTFPLTHPPLSPILGHLSGSQMDDVRRSRRRCVD